MSLRGQRQEDTPTTRIWSRSERVFQESGNWHFYTREGTVEGPYDSKIKALDKLDVYIRLMLAGLSMATLQGPRFELQPL